MYETFKDLVGKTIIEIRGDSSALYFVTNEGTFKATADGACCSHSWFEHFDNPEFLIGAKVESVEDVDANSVITEREYQEKGYDSIQQYGYKFTTLKGNAILELRNDSNGYYGGCASVSKYSGNPYNQPLIKEGF